MNWLDIGQMDDMGRMDTPVHRLDARAKAMVTMVFIVTVVSFGRYEVSALMPFFLYPAVLLSLGRIPPGAILKRILVAAPFALVIGVFNPFIDRQPAIVLGPVSITGGWLSFASIMLRFALTVGAALTLVACTGMHRLCSGLEQLGCPRVFVAQLLFLYRYLFAVAEDGGTMMRGVELRLTGNRHIGLGVYGSLIGHLLLRSMDRAERVYLAMVARGFDGEIRVMQKTVFRPVDIAFVCCWTVLFIAARVWNPAAELGRLLAGRLP